MSRIHRNCPMAATRPTTEMPIVMIPQTMRMAAPATMLLPVRTAYRSPVTARYMPAAKMARPTTCEHEENSAAMLPR